MSIPDYQTIMLPLLQYLADKKEKASQETFDALAEVFGLSEEERKELLPSGNQSIFMNRIGWAKTYLKKTGFIESPKRGYYSITMRGLNELKKNPNKIDNKYLSQFPEFADFVKTRIARYNSVDKYIEVDNEKTPEENIGYNYQQIRNALSIDVLDKIKKCSPYFFEKLVVELLLKMGYGGSRQEAGKTIGKSVDGGIDGIIKEDKLGLDTIYIQAKRWDGSIGRPEVQKFAGALQGQRARKGVFITTSKFTKEAIDYACMIENKLILIDGDTLSNLMIDYDIGVSIVNTYLIKRIDSDYFVDE
jgi:restriction system protein